MNRDEMIERIMSTDAGWDVLVVGGGATGLGVAVEAASRGYRTLLVEMSDFAKGTSGRSTKLVHGGVRYLRQGNVTLVLEALKERGRLLRNAPHLVRDLPFVVPVYDWWEGPFYGIGLRLYDLLAGREGFGTSHNLSREETLERLPTIEPDGLRGGVIYYDGQFDDARLAINLAATAADLGATVVNHMRVSGLTHSNDLVDGAIVVDEETGVEQRIHARVVINATGVFTDTVRTMDDPTASPMVQASQGIHIVVDSSFMPGESAIMVPETDDGRVLFAIPWHGRVVIGTTDTPVDEPSLEPRPLQEELEFVLHHAARYLTRDPGPKDVLSMFAGLRPLVRQSKDEGTAEISRDHTVHISRSGLVTITGGKWTTYRRMAEETVDRAAVIAHLEDRLCVTREMRLHGWVEQPDDESRFAVYGSDATVVDQVCREKTEWMEPLHERLPYLRGEVVYATRYEMARTVDDVLSRRLRALLLDARASIDAAPFVARTMAAELGRDEKWIERQVKDYTMLARGYIMSA
ncbi:MAG: glycerol-3-phosphate dehydrogenase/oxidase [Rhodothermales bacterium]|nr:glycerol-3-phosphate dehydrogenase/oxidase [Rhodothermales bacterium]